MATTDSYSSVFLGAGAVSKKLAHGSHSIFIDYLATSVYLAVIPHTSM